MNIVRNLRASAVGGCVNCLDASGLVTLIEFPTIEIRVCDKCRDLLRENLGPGSIDPVRRGGGKVGRRHPDTSRQAASTCRAGSQQAHALAVIVRGAVAEGGATSAEIAARIGIARNQVATRVLELREKGLVVAWIGSWSGEAVTRSTGPENDGQVWKATAAGVAECARLAP